MSGSERPKAPIVSERRSTRRRSLNDRRSGAERGVSPSDALDAERRDPTDRRTTTRRSGADRRNEAAWQLVSIDPGLPVSLDGDLTLLAAATAARTRAQAHYSNFMVGAALETAAGEVIGGCNIENATYGLTLCAERVALVKALSDGHSIFTRIAVVADTEAPTPPCGPCRQLLWEYCGDIDIILGNLNGPTGRFRLSALLPMPFDRRLLG